MNASFEVAIDESGDEGSRIGEGSSQWFCLAAAITRCSESAQAFMLVDEVRARINQGKKPDEQIAPRKPLHFRDLKHEQRKYYAWRIAQADIATICVLIDKLTLYRDQSKIQKSNLYYTAVDIILEKIAWFCEDNFIEEEGDGSALIVFSNRASMSKFTLQSHVDNWKRNRSDAKAIQPLQIETHTPGNRIGLQVADAVASSYFYAVEPSAYGLPEEGYVRLLRSCAFSRDESIWHHGVTIFPHDADELRKEGRYLAGF